MLVFANKISRSFHVSNKRYLYNHSKLQRKTKVLPRLPQRKLRRWSSAVQKQCRNNVIRMSENGLTATSTLGRYAQNRTTAYHFCPLVIKMGQTWPSALFKHPLVEP